MKWKFESKSLESVRQPLWKKENEGWAYFRRKRDGMIVSTS